MLAPTVPSRKKRDQGLSLLEVMIAMTVLATGLLSLAQLFGLATASNRAARDTTLVTILAAQKLEELRALSSPSPSPPTALEENTPGFADFVNELGVLLGGGRDAPAGAVYVRRWSVEPLPSDARHTVVIRVVAGRIDAPGVGAQGRDAAGDVGTVHLMTAKTGKAP